jgi:hypothetical protein
MHHACSASNQSYANSFIKQGLLLSSSTLPDSWNIQLHRRLDECLAYSVIFTSTCEYLASQEICGVSLLKEPPVQPAYASDHFLFKILPLNDARLVLQSGSGGLVSSVER